MLRFVLLGLPGFAVPFCPSLYTARTASAVSRELGSRLVYFFLRNRCLAGHWVFRCGDFIRTAGEKLAYRCYLSILLLVVTDMDDTRGGVRTSDAPAAQLVLLGK